MPGTIPNLSSPAQLPAAPGYALSSRHKVYSRNFVPFRGKPVMSLDISKGRQDRQLRQRLPGRVVKVLEGGDRATAKSICCLSIDSTELHGGRVLRLLLNALRCSVLLFPPASYSRLISFQTGLYLLEDGHDFLVFSSVHVCPKSTALPVLF